MEILYIPVSILNEMALWLTEQQNEEGAFVETSEHYYDRSFLVNTFDFTFYFVSCELHFMLHRVR